MPSCLLAPPVKVLAGLGGNATLPCRLPSKDTMFFGATGVRIKWTKVADDPAYDQDVLLSMGFHKKTYGSFEDRAFLLHNDNEDGSILITNLAMEDTGKYHCELINGMTDVAQEVFLEVEGGLRDGQYTPAFLFFGLARCLLAFVSTNALLNVNCAEYFINTESEADCVFHCVRSRLSIPAECFIFVPRNHCSLFFRQRSLHLVPFC